MGKLGGQASVEIDAPIAEVYALLEDVATAPQWQKGLEELNVLSRDAEGRAEQCETVSDAKVKMVKTRVRFSYEPPTAVRWVQEKGDLSSLVGSWELEDLGGDRTKVTYDLEGDPGRMLGMLIRGPVEGALKDILVNGRPGEIKAWVEQSAGLCLRARQLLVGDAVRPVGCLADLLAAPVLVGLEVTLEPGDLGVALEGQHVGSHTIQEPAIVGDDHGTS
jgi:ribosome-associated toxin RatA of RatAB toxin-antitoxin module